MKKYTTFAIILILLFSQISKLHADEGMWLPMLIEKLNIKDMQSKGCKLSAEDIYSVNQASLKDAIVIFGGGCTGEMVSDKGLLFTNHHCGYGTIQSHSSLEHDYLTDGFWAKTQEEELVNKGLTVKFLVRMEDVTSQVLKNVDLKITEKSRQEIIEKNIKQIIDSVKNGNEYLVEIESMFYGNNY